VGRLRPLPARRPEVLGSLQDARHDVRALADLQPDAEIVRVEVELVQDQAEVARPLQVCIADPHRAAEDR
jgi:hypothetical protein